MQKIGRNDPCPCGSGKKYKKRCWATGDSRAGINQDIDYIAINRDIAYRGEIGRKRKAFCIDYIKIKNK